VGEEPSASATARVGHSPARLRCSKAQPRSPPLEHLLTVVVLVNARFDLPLPATDPLEER
jgi:hypothetical protein